MEPVEIEAASNTVVSIIIPVYNSEAYLDECLQSVSLQQTADGRKFHQARHLSSLVSRTADYRSNAGRSVLF